MPGLLDFGLSVLSGPPGGAAGTPDSMNAGIGDTGTGAFAVGERAGAGAGAAKAATTGPPDWFWPASLAVSLFVGLAVLMKR